MSRRDLVDWFCIALVTGIALAWARGDLLIKLWAAL